MVVNFLILEDSMKLVESLLDQLSALNLTEKFDEEEINEENIDEGKKQTHGFLTSRGLGS